MADTPNLGLPYIMAAQAQKHVTHNEAIRALDALVHLTVIDRESTTPPVSPGEGDRYIVAAGGAGAWAGHDLEIAAFQDGGWTFFAPRPGWRAWVIDESALRAWSGSDWVAVGNGGNDGGDGDFDTLGINATADETNRLALSSPASLFNHVGAGHQLKINKAAAGGTASLLYQTAFSGRAEMGTTGDDDFHFKVSPDGSAWYDAILIDKDTGEVSFPSGVDIENPGLPSGGASGQVLAKASNDDGDVAWTTPAGGGDMLASVYDPNSIAADAFDRANHTGAQAIGTITGLQSALDNKAAASHGHALADVSGLQSALDDKAPASHNHDDRYYTEGEIDSALSGKSSTGHGHAISDVTGLQSALDSKAATSHGHAIADVTGLQSALDDKASSSHSHAFADLTSTPTTLSGYGITDAATSAQGALADSAVQPGALGDLASKDKAAIADIDATGSPSASTFLRGDGTWNTPAGGGGGDMLASVYDPNSIAADAFDRANHTGAQAIGTVTGLQSALDSKAATSHDHALADVTDLQTALDGKAAASHNHDDRYYTESEIDSALAGKSSTGHGHAISDVASLQSALDSKAATSHGHAIADVTDLQSALDGKAASSHHHDDRYYTESEIDSALAGKSNTGHSHAVGEVTGLQSALGGKASSSHSHAFADLTARPTTLSGYGITDAATSAQGALADSAVQPDDDATLSTLGINATADETNRLALSSPASLFNHAGAGHQQKINKANASDTASVLYQTAFSGRAEMGTTGDDDFHFKVSPDGSVWHDAILIDKDTGEVSFPSGVDIENPGLPSGGASGQLLAKASNDDGDVTWTTPSGGGDMLASVYDPNSIAADAFDRENHAGAQAIGTITGLQTALDGKATLDPGVNAQSGASYTLTIADRGVLVTMSNAAANTLTIPTDASVPFPVGTIISVIQLGDGATTIAGDTGVTVNGLPGGSGRVGSRFQAAALLKTATDNWTVSGDFGDSAITAVARTLLAQSTEALMRTSGLGFSADGSSLVAAADYAAMRALLAIAQADVSGLGTGASPQFAALNVGHASDTTLGRTAAGILNVEGRDIAFAEPGLNAQTGTSYTLALADKGRIVTMNNASSNKVTIPANSSVAFPLSTIIDVLRIGTGMTTIEAASGVTINGVSGGAVTIANRWQGGALTKIGIDAWVISGAIGDDE